MVLQQASFNIRAGFLERDRSCETKLTSRSIFKPVDPKMQLKRNTRSLISVSQVSGSSRRVSNRCS